MSELLTPADIERLAERAGISMAEVLRRAGVAPSIFSRWKSGKTEPNLENYRRLRDAAAEAVKNRVFLEVRLDSRIELRDAAQEAVKNRRPARERAA